MKVTLIGNEGVLGSIELDEKYRVVLEYFKKRMVNNNCNICEHLPTDFCNLCPFYVEEEGCMDKIKSHPDAVIDLIMEEKDNVDTDIDLIEKYRCECDELRKNVIFYRKIINFIMDNTYTGE